MTTSILPRRHRTPLSLDRCHHILSLFFVWTLFLLAGSLEASAQFPTCTGFSTTPATAFKCDAVFKTLFPNGTYVYPLKGDWDTTDNWAGNQTVFFNAFMPYKCRNALLTLTCLGAFLPCTVLDPPLSPFIIISPPCRSACEDVLLECTAYLTSVNQQNQLPDCDLIDYSTGRPLPAYPPDASGACIPKPNALQVPYEDVDCPYPLKFNYDQEGPLASQGFQPPDQMCLMPCLSPMYSDGEWNGSFSLLIILAFFSNILCIVVLGSMLLLPEKRCYPGVLRVWMIGNGAAYTFVLVFFSIIGGGPQNLTCTQGSPPLQIDMNNAGWDDGHGVICMLQGIGILFFALSGSFWWLGLCFNLFEIICLQRSMQVLRKFQLVYHAFVWGTSLIIVVIALGGQQIGSLPGTKYCLFSIGSEYWSWMLLYLPTGLVLILGTIIWFAVIIRMIQIRFRVRAVSDTWEQLIRLCTFVLAYWIVLVWPWAYRIYTRVEQDHLVSAIQDQITCSAMTGAKCGLSYRYNLGTWIITDIDMSIVGVVVCACLCSSDVVKFWKRVVYLLRNKKFEVAMKKIRNMITGKDTAWNKRSRASSAPVNPDGPAKPALYNKTPPAAADSMATTYDSMSADFSGGTSGFASGAADQGQDDVDNGKDTDDEDEGL